MVVTRSQAGDDPETDVEFSEARTEDAPPTETQDARTRHGDGQGQGQGRNDQPSTSRQAVSERPATVRRPLERAILRGVRSTSTPGTLEPRGEMSQPRQPPAPQAAEQSVDVLQRIRAAEEEAEEQLMSLHLAHKQELVRRRLARDVASIRGDATDVPAQTADTEAPVLRMVQDWIRTREVHAPSTGAIEPRAEAEQLRPSRETRTAVHQPVRMKPVRKVEWEQANILPTFFPPPTTANEGTRSEMDHLVSTLNHVVNRRPPLRELTQLPKFSGAANEWTGFKVAMIHSTEQFQFSPIENIARLRNCLQGKAREAVSSLLNARQPDPERIMKALDRTFGRPEVIAKQAVANIQKMKKPESPVELDDFAIALQNIVSTLQETEGQRHHLTNPQLVDEVLDKLPPAIKEKWVDYAYEYCDFSEPEIVTLAKFIEMEADRRILFLKPNDKMKWASAEQPRERQKNVPSRRQPWAEKRSFTMSADAQSQKQLCSSCGGNHQLPKCPKFLKLDKKTRWELVKGTRVCFRCLASKHYRYKCKAKLCGVDGCTQPHHALLHSCEPASGGAATVSVLNTTADRARDRILLKICPVTIKGPQGEVQTYALLDEGSTVTLVDEGVAAAVGAEGPVGNLRIHGVNSVVEARSSRNVKLLLRGSGQFETITARTVRNMKLQKQTVPASVRRYTHLQEFNAEDVCYMGAEPQILIGVDNWHLIVSRQIRAGAREEPVAVRTSLGWMIMGPLPRMLLDERKEARIHHLQMRHRKSDDRLKRKEHKEVDAPVPYKREEPKLCTGREFNAAQEPSHLFEDPDERLQPSRLFEDPDERLHEMVKTHFHIDALGVSMAQKVKPEDERAVRIFENTIRRNDQRYEVGLPWRYDNVRMPPSFENAFRRLKTMERKMDRDAAFAESYTAQIENLLVKAYAVECSRQEEKEDGAWFLPHFAVRNPNKPGKIRLVFDAAAVCNGTSLNQKLLEGPDLLQSLPGILYRFREKPIAVTADIQEMFLQVKIREEDQPSQMFLWRGSDRQQPPKKYKMTSMIFGASCSPFLAHSVRNKNAKEFEHSHPAALDAITKSHYMDDFVDSFMTIEEARKVVKDVDFVHKQASFMLRGWNSNERSILSHIPPELCCKTQTLLMAGMDKEEKTLGLIWDSQRDELGFNTTMPRVRREVKDMERPPTKRETLSAVMSIYDPLGLLGPYTIVAKIMLQSLWRLNVGWDEPIPDEQAELFFAWMQGLDNIGQLRLPRCYEEMDEDGEKQLHVFCDASELAYAAVAYWRIEKPDGTVTIRLAASKAKVAPLKSISIPRLELQAAVIGARLADAVKREHRWEATSTTFWSDSRTVLIWVRTNAKKYTPFVAHRLGEIAERTNPSQWRWVPTKENPADDATRSSYISGPRTEWLEGPGFLRQPNSDWPAEGVQERGEPEEEALVHHATQETPPHWEAMPDISRISKWDVLIRATARVLYIASKWIRKSTRLEVQHLQMAEKLWLERAQEESFDKEIRLLKHGQPVPRSSRLYKLDPIYGADCLLRVRGRIDAAPVNDDQKRPIILDGRHKLVRMMIQKEHEAAGHAGHERVVNDLRQRYWILHLRPSVRVVARTCQRCQIRKTVPKIPAFGDLPEARLAPFSRPFKNTGVDYFGPMSVTIGRRHEKRWCALFTCLTTRAIHLELVASLSTDSAIQAIRRMAARRGWPSVMYSDNATNFRGADVEMRAAWKEWAEPLREFCMNKMISWKYIPPGAPNQGGAWERLVRSVKNALSATLEQKYPKEETLHTLLVEAEHAINARPLTHVSVTLEDPEALTPNHFLIGSSSGLPVVGPCHPADKRTWRAAQALADEFWRRWVKEYLPDLVPRGSAAQGSRQLQQGDLVVVVDPNLPRNVWPRGIVERTYEGPDGEVRCADVRTQGGVFRRPTRKLAVLPVVKEAASPERESAPGGGCCGQLSVL